jgi:hypothetical protein
MRISRDIVNKLFSENGYNGDRIRHDGERYFPEKFVDNIGKWTPYMRFTKSFYKNQELAPVSMLFGSSAIMYIFEDDVTVEDEEGQIKRFML